jgi:hypothetical protein
VAPGVSGTGFSAHNAVVRLLVEGGIILLGAVVALCVAIIRRVRRLARERWENAYIAKALVALWSIVFVVGITTDDPLDATVVMYALLLLTGALDAAHRSWLIERGRRSPVPPGRLWPTGWTRPARGRRVQPLPGPGTS